MTRLSFSLCIAVLLHETSGFFVPQQSSIRSHRGDLKITSKLLAVHKDIVIIGGSLAGLSIALELATSGEKCQITVLDGEIPAVGRSQTEFGKTNIASMAAAGMLAPMSERLPSGPLLDICLESRAMYADWVQKIEKLAQAGPFGEKYLWKDDKEQSKMESWEIGYKCTGGFLAPAFAGDSVATWAPPSEGGDAIWLDQPQILEMEPNINPEVVGGWWFPSDASVDARRLTCSLRAACANCGVELCYGKDYKVTGVDQSNPNQVRIQTSSGVTYEPNKVVTANGAWMKEILPIAIVPHKGQSLSVTLADGEGIDRVLFAQDTYIVPKADGRVIVGATVEPNTFDNVITPSGMMHIISNACELLPSIAKGKIGEVWCGLRPTTPDKAPILGTTKHQQVFIAGGYWRNGVLLAPKSAQIMTDLLLKSDSLSDSDKNLLTAFNWDRFYDKDKSKQLAADIRYKSQMHSVQYRGKGSATAGVELGFYEGAKAAKAEREADRKRLFSTSDDDSSFEKAAAMGKQDATAFIVNENDNAKDSKSAAFTLDQGRIFPDFDTESETVQVSTDIDAHEKANALTVGASNYLDQLTISNQKESLFETDAQLDGDDNSVDLQAMYASIKANKVVSTPLIENTDENEMREEFDFELYWIDEESSEEIFVPPFTSPGEMEEIVASKKREKEDAINEPSETNGNETIHDGYTDIMEKNSRNTRSEELDAMRQSRISNRSMESDAFGSSSDGKGENKKPSTETDFSRLEALYKSISTNKAVSTPKIIDDIDNDNNEIFDFELHLVDPETGEEIFHPPNTSPAEFDEMIADMKVQESRAVEDITNPVEPSNNNVNKQLNTEPDETTFDGYTDIQKSNSRSTRSEELEAMRAARIANRGMESEAFGSS